MVKHSLAVKMMMMMNLMVKLMQARARQLLWSTATPDTLCAPHSFEYWNKYIQRFTNIFKYIQINTNIWKYENLHKYLQICKRIYKYVQMYTNIHKCVQIYTIIYKFIQTYTSICNFPPKHIFFYEYTHLQNQCALERYKNENAIFDMHVYQV